MISTTFYVNTKGIFVKNITIFKSGKAIILDYVRMHVRSDWNINFLYRKKSSKNKKFFIYIVDCHCLIKKGIYIYTYKELL
jgi:hypothetical protein